MVATQKREVGWVLVEGTWQPTVVIDGFPHPVTVDLRCGLGPLAERWGPCVAEPVGGTEPGRPDGLAEFRRLVAESWVVRHKPTGTWWRAKQSGYTGDLLAAGLYSEGVARSCSTRRCPLKDGSYEDECMPLTVAWKGAEEGTMLSILYRLASDPDMKIENE